MWPILGVFNNVGTVEAACAVKLVSNLVVERHDYLMRLLGKGGIDTCEAAYEAASRTADLSKEQER